MTRHCVASVSMHSVTSPLLLFSRLPPCVFPLPEPARRSKTSGGIPSYEQRLFGALSRSPPLSHQRWGGGGDPLRVAYRIIAGWSGTIPEGSCTPFIWALILTIFARWALTCHRFGGAHSMTYLMQLYPKRAYPDSTLDQRHDQGRLAFWSLFGFCSGNGAIRPGQGPPVCCTCLGPFLIYCVRLPCHWIYYHRARSS